MYKFSLLLFIFVISCNTTKNIPSNPNPIPDTSNKTDTVHKKYIIWDTIHKKKKVWDTIYKPYPVDSVYKVPKPIDSPYMFPVPIDSVYFVPLAIDSPYYVPKPIDSPYTVPRPIDSPYCVNDTIPDDTIITEPPDTTVYKETKYGLMQASDDKSVVMNAMKSAGINFIRLPLFYERTIEGQVIDEFLKAGFLVQINFNWKSTSSPVLFPTDTVMIRSKAEAFFKYYLPYRTQILFVAVENEWDNDYYRDWTKAKITDYITELKIVCEVGHKYGFKVTDAGITGNTLGRWTYSQLSIDSAKWWKTKYFVGTDATNYQPMLKLVSDYVKLIKDVPIDYLNTHWYNNNGRCSEGYSKAYDLYAKACGKENLPRVNNEFGIRNANIDIWKCTVKEMKQAKIVYAIAYSGDGSTTTPAQRLTYEYLIEMK